MRNNVYASKLNDTFKIATIHFTYNKNEKIFTFDNYVENTAGNRMKKTRPNLVMMKELETQKHVCKIPSRVKELFLVKES